MKMLFNPSHSYTYDECIKALSNLLKSTYTDPFNSALLLLTFITKNDNTTMLSNVDNVLTENQIIRLNKIIELIKDDFPIAYIISNTEFYKENYNTTQDTLIPRPESELLVDLALNFLNQLPPSKKIINCLEIGTGTGCLAISILNNTNLNLNFVATDISKAALKVAQQNAKKILTAQKKKSLQFQEQDFLKTLPSGLFDLIISNPPYIPLTEYQRLPKSLTYEPEISLTDYSDGSVFYKQIAKLVSSHLAENGRLIVEVHSQLAKKIDTLFKTETKKTIISQIHKDMFGRDRAIEVTLKAQ